MTPGNTYHDTTPGKSAELELKLVHIILNTGQRTAQRMGPFKTSKYRRWMCPAEPVVVLNRLSTGWFQIPSLPCGSAAILLASVSAQDPTGEGRMVGWGVGYFGVYF